MTLTSLTALGQQPASAPSAPSSNSPVSPTTSKGSDLEQQKLEIERMKAWLTVGSILVPLLTGIGAIYWQVRSSAQLKETEAKNAFELKAAEIVLSSSSPAAAVGRAKALASLFPHRLPPQFATSFNSTEFPGTIRHEIKIELFRAIAQNPEHKDDIVAAARQIFPKEESWINERFPQSTKA